MSISDEGLICQRQSSLFEVEMVQDTDDADAAFRNDHQICVELLRAVDGFGLTIEGGIDRSLYPNDSGIFVTSIRDGSSAQKQKFLEVGDKILEANGHSFVGLTHSEAVQYFKDSRRVVRLLLHKHVGLILEATAMTEESLDSMDSPSASPRELKGFSPVGFVVGITMGCIAVLALRRYLMQK